MVRVTILPADAEWKPAGFLPGEVSATAAAALPHGGGLLGLATGVAGPFGPGQPRGCAIVQCGAALRTVYRSEGQIVALAVHERFVFAVRGTQRADGMAYAGVRSDDPGASWADAGPIRAPSINRLAVASNGLVLASGGNRTLVASRDFGATWSSHRAPMPFSSVRDFATIHEGEPAIVGAGVRLLALGDRAEVRQELLPDVLEVMSLRDGYMSALAEQQVKLASVGAAGVEWGPHLAADRLVLAVTHSAPTVWRVLMRARDPGPGGTGYAVASTQDAGASWVVEEQRIGPASDIRGMGGVGVEPITGRVLVRLASEAS